MELPASLCRAGAEFTLSDKLTVTACRPAVDQLAGRTAGISPLSPAESAADGMLKVTYEGPMDYGLSDQKEEYTRGFRETRGMSVTKECTWTATAPGCLGSMTS